MRAPRMRWKSTLHARFVHSVEFLGGHETTPKSVLELMDVKDLTLAHVKSHLQRHDIFKKRIDSHGNVIEVRQEEIGAPKVERPLQRHGGRLEHNETYCVSCFGAEMSDDECCNSCEEVRSAYRKKGWAISNTDSIDQED
ncbi:unnamed protein product [Cuscuta epithymum]|uniref:Endoplasmic reticulum vesicle transporter C-terminal domain-containing protein n=1 Tax=Cuscuta epithymum TaxID=186058 RepID=A0AAV0G012_9ASTE|nr:unnamed protein product [Cuscuta epithymum]